jgi:hypothetical protein
MQGVVVVGITTLFGAACMVIVAFVDIFLFIHSVFFFIISISLSIYFNNLMNEKFLLYCDSNFNKKERKKFFEIFLETENLIMLETINRTFAL